MLDGLGDGFYSLRDGVVGYGFIVFSLVKLELGFFDIEVSLPDNGFASLISGFDNHVMAVG